MKSIFTVSLDKSFFGKMKLTSKSDKCSLDSIFETTLQFKTLNFIKYKKNDN